LPGAVGNETSTANESFSEGLLDHPQYTRPTEFAGLRVPDVLLTGYHERSRAGARGSTEEERDGIVLILLEMMFSGILDWRRQTEGFLNLLE